MVYRKIELSEGGKVSTKTGTKTTRAFKKAFSAIKKNFSTGTNKMADSWVKNADAKKSQKIKKLKGQTFVMAKNISMEIKHSFKGITPKKALCDFSYALGGVFKETKEILRD
ncbi:MAG: hypothetical protein HQL15_01460, partial [Candidatus Omnitrophica bacterium]|nr:hypothetical protein [Candidatus Omnitrophota bacterium]